MHPSLAAERRSLRHMTAVSRHAALFVALTLFAVAASGMGPSLRLARSAAVTISSPPNVGGSSRRLQLRTSGWRRAAMWSRSFSYQVWQLDTRTRRCD
jgi:hypothetical protein